MAKTQPLVGDGPHVYHENPTKDQLKELDLESYTAAEPEDLCMVKFPTGMVVTGNPGRALEAVDGRVVLADVPRSKAMHYAFVAGAEVKDSDDNLIAQPKTTVTDSRPESAAKSVVVLTAEVERLSRLVESMTKVQETKTTKVAAKSTTKATK